MPMPDSQLQRHLDLMAARHVYALHLVHAGKVKPGDTRAERHTVWAEERELLRQALVAVLLASNPDMTEQPAALLDDEPVGGTGT